MYNHTRDDADHCKDGHEQHHAIVECVFHRLEEGWLLWVWLLILSESIGIKDKRKLAKISIGIQAVNYKIF